MLTAAEVDALRIRETTLARLSQRLGAVGMLDEAEVVLREAIDLRHRWRAAVDEWTRSPIRAVATRGRRSA